ncbi:hypothetical protein OOK41_08970 [Micromonospora sp. NBC_01655]|uniref:hypothetical protein n=1 Tax=Micromonospora sp. NBC_01655 TaxID=2975983 RepID=UPI0022552012|nr:hypothetical protein [Micromonospora sp. NBC_01655]MCX4470436.1 hypothetical protein [Micromonospora sp. NBC_01655]
MSQPATATPTSALTPRDRLRLFRILGRMPFGAGVRGARSPEEMTVDSLADTLEALVDRLNEHGDECQARDAKLQEHEDLIRAGRRLFAALAAPQD